MRKITSISPGRCVIGKENRIFGQALTLQLLYYGVTTCFILGRDAHSVIQLEG